MPNSRLLILTPQLPYPPDQGAPIRNWNFIRYLGSSDHYEVTLLSFSRPHEYQTPLQTKAQQALAQFCQQVEIVPVSPSRSKLTRLRDLLLNKQPDLALRLQSGLFEAKLRELLQTQTFEAILVEGLELAPFLLAAFKDLPQRPHLILDEHNAEWLLQYRAYQNDRAQPRRWPVALYSFWQARRLRRYEAQAAACFDRVIVVSPADKAALTKIGVAPARIAVIPNGIDLVEFCSRPDLAEEPDRLVFTGTMDFRPNVDAVSWFVQEIWPQIRAHKPSARFTIVGRRPTKAVLALAQVAGVEVTGSVPDARPYIWKSAVYVVPMRIGGGVRFKVLEALAMGKAVVTTPMGADGIPIKSDQEALVAAEPKAESQKLKISQASTIEASFAQAVLDLLNNPALRKQLGENGRDFVAAQFDWNKITPLLDEVIRH